MIAAALGACALSVLLPPSLRAEDTEGARFESPQTGFSMVPPPGWVRLAKADEAAGAAAVPPGRRSGPRALVAFARYPEPYPSLNPTIQITVGTAEAYDGGAPADGLARVVAAYVSRVQGFEAREAVAPATLGELPAARARVAYTVTGPSGAALQVASELWLVVAGRLCFLIALDGPPDGPDASEQAFRDAVASIVIRPIGRRPIGPRDGTTPADANAVDGAAAARPRGHGASSSTPPAPYQPKSPLGPRPGGLCPARSAGIRSAATLPDATACRRGDDADSR
jgi:hypothetical protein